MTAGQHIEHPNCRRDDCETIATFTHRGRTYEIDHLGIGDGHWGEFEVYTAAVGAHIAGEDMGGFAIPESALKPESRPVELPVTTEQLIELARATIDGTADCTPECTHPEGQTAGHPFPGRPGYITGDCQHAVAGSEWRAGIRKCERC